MSSLGGGAASGRVLHPPPNFSMVEKGLYRSSFPTKKNFSFLSHLGIRSILTLVLEDYPEANLKFQREHGIALLQVGMPGNKEPFVDIPPERVALALALILDKRLHPSTWRSCEGQSHKSARTHRGASHLPTRARTQCSSTATRESIERDAW